MHRPWVAALALAVLGGGCGAGEAPPRELILFNAGSLALPLGTAARAFAEAEGDVRVLQESAGSLETIRKLTELGKVPDILGVADAGLLPELIVPGHAAWHAVFATNAMVLLRSTDAPELLADRWWEGLLRPGVRVGRANPALDPNGYRTLMVLQLVAHQQGDPSLAGRLLAAMPERYVRPKEAELTALVQAGELDYAWSYRNIGITSGLAWSALPDSVDLSNPDLADWYARASVRIPGSTLAGADSLALTATPITYGITIPTAAPHAETAQAFLRFLFSEAGRAILAEQGLQPVRPRFEGVPPASVTDPVAPAAATR